MPSRSRRELLLKSSAYSVQNIVLAPTPNCVFMTRSHADAHIRTICWRRIAGRRIEMEHWTARARRFRYAADDEVALHPIARRRVVAAALLCVSLLALLWPAPHGAKPGAGSNCETR